jgi:hypothetical protein
MKWSAMDTIERQAAIEAIDGTRNKFNGDYDDRSTFGVVSDCVDALKKLPSAQKKCNWICKDGIIRCSVCKKVYLEIPSYFNYCPNCGSKTYPPATMAGGFF